MLPFPFSFWKSAGSAPPALPAAARWTFDVPGDTIDLVQVTNTGAVAGSNAPCDTVNAGTLQACKVGNGAVRYFGQLPLMGYTFNLNTAIRTMAMWVKNEGLDQNNRRRYWYFGTTYSHFRQDAGTTYVGAYIGGALSASLSAAVAPHDAWNHYAITCPAGDTYGGVRMFVNGVLVTVSSVYLPTLTSLRFTDGATNPYMPNTARASIDQIMASPAQFSDAEILALYNSEV